MATVTELSVGSVPALYREVYDILSPNQEHVDHEMFVKLLVKSSLPKSTLSQIWDASVDNKQGFMTRIGLYKALALTAMAQQGKAVNPRLLDNYSDKELPRPSLGDLGDLQKLSIKVRRDKQPSVLGFAHQELKSLDSVKVELVPEKKGLILKHVEYEVTSLRFNCTVRRRYNDFIALQDMLLLRFPYRMIPRLPPKKMMGADREFIESRRRSLRRFLNLVARHPVLSEDQIIKFFFTFNGSDMQYKIREHFRGVPDEFMTSDVAVKAKEIVPIDTPQQFSNSKEHIRILTASVMKLKDIADRMVMRATGYANDMIMLGKELSIIANDPTPVSVWASGTNDSWVNLKKGFKRVAVEFAAISDKSSTQASREDKTVVEELTTFLDLLGAYRDLCERHEKGVLNDHQRALQKMGQYKKKKTIATIKDSEQETVEQLEEKILRQEGEISNMENRNYFSLHCVQMETQLIHANLEVLYCALDKLVLEEGRAHTELGQLWDQLKPLLTSMLPGVVSNGSALSSPTGTKSLASRSLSTDQTGISV